MANSANEYHAVYAEYSRTLRIWPSQWIGALVM
jgi:hypothetical protein